MVALAAAGPVAPAAPELCVVDGEVGFVGGINLIDDRIDLHHGASEQPRLDFAVELRGPVVQAVGQAARAVWTRAWLEPGCGRGLLAWHAAPRAWCRRPRCGGACTCRAAVAG